MIVETENMEPATDGIRGSSFLCGVLGVHIVCFFHTFGVASLVVVACAGVASEICRCR